MIQYQERELEGYQALLAPLFRPQGSNAFELACTLIRVGGMQGPGWDPLEESTETLADLMALFRLKLEPGQFKNPEKTRWRLLLISYAHLVEMDAPYDVLANLLRLRLKLPFSITPFQGVAVQSTTRKKPKTRPLAAPMLGMSPIQKIEAIKKLASQAGCASIGNAFEEFYFPSLRNSIDHSDYILHDNEFRMRNGYITEEGNPNSLTPVIKMQRLGEIIGRAFAFYQAFFGLELAARAWFGRFKGQGFPLDRLLKGLVEFLIDENGLLVGFKVHWPNEQDSIYRRLSGGCEALNISHGLDGTIGFVVGEYFQDRHSFSRLVPLDREPKYTAAEGATEPLQWPSEKTQTSGTSVSEHS